MNSEKTFRENSISHWFIQTASEETYLNSWAGHGWFLTVGHRGGTVSFPGGGWNRRGEQYPRNKSVKYASQYQGHYVKYDQIRHVNRNILVTGQLESALLNDDAPCVMVSPRFGEEKPWHAVANSENPQSGDNPLGSADCTDGLGFHRVADGNVPEMKYRWGFIFDLKFHFTFKIHKYIILFSGGSRIFPRGGANSQKCYYFSIFLPKTAWKWKNLDPQGGARVPGAPLGSANAIIWPNFPRNCMKMKKKLSQWLGARPWICQWHVSPVTDLGGARHAWLPPPFSPISSIFMQFSAKIMQNNRLVPS